MFTHLMQDCFATIPPFPYYEGDPDEFHIVRNMEDILYGRPILMFSCIFHPCGRPKADASADFKCKLVYFSAFQDLVLESERGNPMQDLGGIKMLYEPGPWDPRNPTHKMPILNVGYLEHILCRAPLVPCFLDGSSTNTIPFSKRDEISRLNEQHKRENHGEEWPGKCDSRPGAGNGSLVYEVNMPLWRFGRPKARSMTVSEAETKRGERVSAARRQAQEKKK